MANPITSSLQHLRQWKSTVDRTAHLSVGSELLGAAWKVTPSWSFVGSGPYATRAIVADTAAAVEIMNGPSGALVQQRLTGMLSELDARQGSKFLSGIALPLTPEQKIAASVLPVLTRVGEMKRRELVDNWLSESLPELTKSAHYPVYEGLAGRITVDPWAAKQLMGLDGRTPKDAVEQEALEALSHELWHAVTPQPPDTAALTPLEETSAEILTRLGGVEEMAARMGITAVPHTVLSAVSAPIGGLGVLLEYVGLGPNSDIGAPADPSRFDRAARLLQSRDPSRVVDALASEIARVHNISGDAVAKIAQALPQAIDDRDVAKRFAEAFELKNRPA